MSGSAPGEDGIPYSFLCNLGDKTRKYYLNLINCVMMSNIVPNSWKSQIVIPILKPNITFSPVLVKMAEHLIKIDWNGMLSTYTIF